jgi:ribosome-binding protein aMBF1 (putative translation factor)
VEEGNFKIFDDSSAENKRLLQQEEFILSITEEIWGAMEKMGMTKKDLAAAIDRSESFVTQVLNGSRNMTLRTLSDISRVLNLEFCLKSQTDDFLPINYAMEDAALGRAIKEGRKSEFVAESVIFDLLGK